MLGKQKSNSIRDHLRVKSALGNVHIVDNAICYIKNGRLDVESVKNIISSDDYSLVKTLIQSQEAKKGFN